MASKKPYGIWVHTLKEWMMEDSSSNKKARYKLKREAEKEAQEFNRVLKNKKPVYEARKIR